MWTPAGPKQRLFQKYTRDDNSSRRDGANRSRGRWRTSCSQALVINTWFFSSCERRQKKRGESQTRLWTHEINPPRWEEIKNNKQVKAACLVNTRRDYDWEQRWTRAAVDDREATPDEWQWRTDAFFPLLPCQDSAVSHAKGCVFHD